MKLALVVGNSTGETLKTRLRSLKDNLEIDVFEDVPYFIDMTYKRNIIYNRILITATLLNDRLVKDLHNFWTDFTRDSQIVVLGKKDRDDALVRSFMTTFQSTMMGSLLVPATTIPIIADACFLPVQDLNEKFGISDFLNLDFDTNIMEEPDEEPQEDTFEEPEIDSRPPRQNNSILSALMGTNRQQSSQQPIQEESQYEDSYYDEGQDAYQDDYGYQDNQGYSDDYNYEDGQQPYDNNDGYEEPFNYDPNQQQYPEEQYQNEQADFQGFDEYTEQDAFYDESQNSYQYEEFSEQGQPVDTFDTEPVFEDDSTEFQSYDDYQKEIENLNTQAATTAEDAYDYQDEFSTQDDFSEPSYDSPIEEPTNFDEPVTPSQSRRNQNSEANSQQSLNLQPLEVEEDFGSMVMPVNTSTAQPPTSKRQSTIVDEIEEDLSNLNLGQSEQQYKQTKEQPKVVVREVVKSTGTITGIYDAVKKGAIHKTIVVTGDRCTGVTLTALNIAKTISAHTSVLYVDLDNHNHGSLNYLDYSVISDYEQMHLKGTKVCKNPSIFDNCVIRYDKNLDILISDYSEVVTYDDIVSCAKVVAEKALDYTVVVIDCPLLNLKAIEDILIDAMPVVCVEGTKRGFMNMLCGLDESSLENRIKRIIASRAELFVTKCTPADAKKWLGYIHKVYQPTATEIDWMKMRPSAFGGNMTDKLMNRILEG